MSRSSLDSTDAFRRRAWAEVDLDAIRSNVRALAARVHGAEIVAVVKAEAYGHGAPEVAAAALEGGATRLAVALPEEGVALRAAGFPESVPILVLGATPPAHAATVVQHRLEQVVSSRKLVEALATEARRLGVRARVHLKVDTGMGRLGFKPGEDAIQAAQLIASAETLELVGVMTHLAESESEDTAFTLEQLRQFREVLRQLSDRGIPFGSAHAANSAAATRFAEARFSYVRTGIMMYGLYPGRTCVGEVELRPALSWKARICHIKRVDPGTSVGYGRTYVTSRDEVIATVPVGYADGLRRVLSNKGEVLVDGIRAPIVGNICMDQFMVRIPQSLASEVGDLETLLGREVVLIGRQGEEEISADEVASLLGSINYEVVTGISWRVPRVYLRDGRICRARCVFGAVDFP